jgi:hypothetical protein
MLLGTHVSRRWFVRLIGVTASLRLIGPAAKGRPELVEIDGWILRRSDIA